MILKQLLLLIILTLLLGCEPNPVRSTYQTANSVTSGVPNKIIREAGYFPKIGATTLTKKQFHAMNNAVVCQCTQVNFHFQYCGSEGDYHYLRYIHMIGTRHFARILKEDHPIENEFPLTIDSRHWVTLFNNQYKHLEPINLEGLLRGRVQDDSLYVENAIQVGLPIQHTTGATALIHEQLNLEPSPYDINVQIGSPNKFVLTEEMLNFIETQPEKNSKKPNLDELVYSEKGLKTSTDIARDSIIEDRKSVSGNLEIRDPIK